MLVLGTEGLDERRAFRGGHLSDGLVDSLVPSAFPDLGDDRGVQTAPVVATLPSGIWTGAPFELGGRDVGILGDVVGGQPAVLDEAGMADRARGS